MAEIENVDISIKDTEESKGGVKFELLLAEPTSATPPKRATSPTIEKILTAEDIDNKLKAASERRQSLENLKLNQINEQLTKAQEVNQKKLKLIEDFVQTSKETLETKMEANKENREALIKEKQEKVKATLQHVEEVRQTVAAQIEELMINIQRKIGHASEVREAQITALQQRLKEHDQHMADVKKCQDDLKGQLQEKYNKKLELANENRAFILKVLQEKMAEKIKKVEEVRQNKLANVGKVELAIKAEELTNKNTSVKENNIVTADTNGNQEEMDETIKNKTDEKGNANQTENIVATEIN